MKHGALARLLGAALVALPLAACSLVLGLDEDFVEVTCLRDCADAAADAPDQDATLPDAGGTDAPSDQSSTDVEAGDPCGFVDVTESTVADNADYAGWPMPQFSQVNVASYSVQGDVVVDNVTKLRWRKGAAPTSMSLADGALYCAGLDAAGGPAWRLPTRIELVSLLLYKTPLSRNGQFIQPCIAPELGPISAGEAGYFWSSTAVAGQPDRHWAVYFPTCGANAEHPDTYAISVRCVQGPPSKARFQVSEKCGIVRDNNTALEWARENKSTKLYDQQDGGPTIELARAACAALGADPEKGLGWVVPTETELYSIIDTSRTQPAMSTVLFPGTPGSSKLLSRSVVRENVVAAVELANGEETGALVSEEALLKCVRHVSK